MTARTVAAALVGCILLAAPPANADDRATCFDAAEAAQKLRSAGKPVEARAELLKCTRDVCPKLVREDCTKWIGEVDRDMPTMVVRAKTAKDEDVDGAILVDGVEAQPHVDGKPVPIDPGPHTLKIVPTDPRFPPQETKVIIVQGEKSRIVTLAVASKDDRPPNVPNDKLPPQTPPAAPSSSTRWVGWTLGGLGLASIATFAVLQIVAHGELDDVSASACGQARTCPASDLDPIKTKFVAAGVMLAVGGALLVTSIIWLIADRPAAPKQPITVGLAPLPGGGGFVGLGGRF